MTSQFIVDQKLQPSKVLKLRRKLLAKLKSNFADDRLAGDKFQSLVDAFVDLLPGKLERETVFESLRDVAGLSLSVRQLDMLCWRLAGNLSRLKQCRPVKPWAVQKHREKVYAQITDVRQKRGGRKGKQFGHEVTFTIITGMSCTLQTYQWWSLKRARFMAYFRDDKGKGFVFPKSWPDRPNMASFIDSSQFFGLRCQLFIEPSQGDEDYPFFSQVGHDTGTTTWNKKMHQRRSRVHPSHLCKFSYSHDLACHNCHRGVNDCPAATRQLTLISGQCPQCGVESWFDPSLSKVKCCLTCWQQKQMSLEE